MAETKLQRQWSQDDEVLRDLKLTCMGNLLSSTEERVYFKDLCSRFLPVSAGWIAAITPGRIVEEIVGKTDFDFFSHEHAAAAFEHEQRIIRTGEPMVEKMVEKLERETFNNGTSPWVSTTKRLKVDSLKIDRSFVEQIGRSSRDREIVAAVTTMSHALGITVVGEGIETSRQLATLAGLDCDHGQVFLFARPLSPEAVVELVV